MKNKLIVGILLLIVLFCTENTFAQTGYRLLSWSVDGGGLTTSRSGRYTLGGTIGQPDAGKRMKNENYTLAGGFWPGINKKKKTQLFLFLPAILNSAMKIKSK